MAMVLKKLSISYTTCLDGFSKSLYCMLKVLEYIVKIDVAIICANISSKI